MTAVEITVMTIVTVWLLLAFTLIDMQVRREQKSFNQQSERRGFAVVGVRRGIKGRIRTF